MLWALLPVASMSEVSVKLTRWSTLFPIFFQLFLTTWSMSLKTRFDPPPPLSCDEQGGGK